MKAFELTPELKRIAKKVLDSQLPKLHTTENGWRFCDEHTDDSYKTWKRTWDILPLKFVNGKYLCLVDCGFGHDIVIDTLNEKLYTASQGIFEPHFVFLSDYYGYPNGAFFELQQ